MLYYNAVTLMDLLELIVSQGGAENLRDIFLFDPHSDLKQRDYCHPQLTAEKR